MHEMQNKVLLVATVRHFFIGLGLALHDTKHAYHLVFINQKFDDIRNPVFRACLKILKPFHSVTCLPINVSGTLNKYKQRKSVFKNIRELMLRLKPIEIATGNDRRLEFQYAMHFCRNKLRLDVVGSYLDNGNGSYISYERLNLRKYLSRVWVDVYIKKLIYGLWFSTAYKYGDSHWIAKCYLCHLNYAPDYFAEKKCSEVSLSFYRTEYAKEILAKFVGFLGLDDIGEIEGSSMLMVLPRVKMIEDIYGSLPKAVEIIKEVSQSYDNVYIKYHPADSEDALGLEGGSIILPPSIPAEILLGVMQFDYILGDTSTAIMAAKWMFPESRVEFIDTGSPYTLSIKKLYMSMGILPFDPREVLL